MVSQRAPTGRGRPCHAVACVKQRRVIFRQMLSNAKKCKDHKAEEERQKKQKRGSQKRPGAKESEVIFLALFLKPAFSSPRLSSSLSFSSPHLFFSFFFSLCLPLFLVPIVRTSIVQCSRAQLCTSGSVTPPGSGPSVVSSFDRASLSLSTPPESPSTSAFH